MIIPAKNKPATFIPQIHFAIVTLLKIRTLQVTNKRKEYTIK